MTILALAAACLLALAHVLAGRMRSLHGVPRSTWLSAAGGISVAYVFIHLLPELARGQRELEEAGEGLPLAETHVYLLSLVGLALFYGVEIHSRRSRVGQERTTAGAFWLSVGSFATYNVLIGYLLLHRVDEGAPQLLLFAAAMLLHLLVNDVGLREHHREQYTKVGRWVLAAAVLVGAGVGTVADLPGSVLAVLIGLLSGGIILNVLKEELPSERRSRFSAFLLGAGGYTALLLTLA